MNIGHDTTVYVRSLPAVHLDVLPPIVAVIRTGLATVDLYLTPQEARQFAAELIATADALQLDTAAK